MEMVIFRRDDLKFGILLGLLAPILSLVIYYLVRFYPHFSVSDFFTIISTNHTQITAISMPCLVLNIVLFTVYINTHRDKTAKGIFTSTILYAITSLVLKFIW